MIGGTIVRIDRITKARWWCAVRDGEDECAVYFDPAGEPVEIGDALWWQGEWCLWTSADRLRCDVKLKKIGYSHSTEGGPIHVH